MDTTTTEHDFRFPRRPYESSVSGGTADRSPNTMTANTRMSAAAANPGGNKNQKTESSPGELRMQELNLDLSKPDYLAHHDLLNSSIFPALQDGMAGHPETLEQMQQSDPLATQVWRFFSRTKQSLPSQERMENLTWRMMHMRLRKQEQLQLQQEQQLRQQQQANTGYDDGCVGLGAVEIVSNSSCRAARSTGLTANGPSGIAQLRKASDQNLGQFEPMNLDDFIFSESLATPAGMPVTPSPEIGARSEDRAAAHTAAAAIPIKSRKSSSQQHFVPQSVPVAPQQRNQDEFGYITRHPRKTSIDERRVSTF